MDCFTPEARSVAPRKTETFCNVRFRTSPGQVPKVEFFCVEAAKSTTRKGVLIEYYRFFICKGIRSVINKSGRVVDNNNLHVMLGTIVKK